MKWIIVAAVLTLAACGGAAPKSDGEPDPIKRKSLDIESPDGSDGFSDPTPTTNISGDKNEPEKAEPKDGKDTEDDECVQACLDRNMARAVAAEIIRKDCQTECADTQSPKE